MPPRHGKSELVSRRLPAFALGRNPDLNVIACSHTADLASDMNRDVQRIIDSEGYRLLFPDTRLYGKNIRTIAGDGTWLRNSDVFEVVGRRGRYLSAGTGGSIAGRGFGIGVIDDPIRSRKEADSEAGRKHVWDWYLSDFYTRRANDDAGILLTVTRWHEDDLPGRLLKQARENPKLPQWTVVRFPAVCEPEDVHPDDPREVGQALWPALFDEAALTETREVSGPRDWASVHQQRPSPAEGNVFKRSHFRTFTEECDPVGRLVFVLGNFADPERPPRRVPAAACRWFQTIDTALTVSRSSAYTCVGTFCLTPQSDLLVYNIFREKLEVPEQFGALMELRAGAAVFDRRSRQWVARGVQNPWPGRLLYQAIETKASGIGLVQQAAAEGKPFRQLKADGDKVMRAAPVSVMFENGKVWFRAGASFLQRLCDELLSFPSGAHADQVDCLSYAGSLATEDTYLRAAMDQPLVCWPPVPGSDDAEVLARIRGESPESSRQPPSSGVDYAGQVAAMGDTPPRPARVPAMSEWERLGLPGSARGGADGRGRGRGESDLQRLVREMATAPDDRDDALGWARPDY
ncbi:MAG TPA: phage terminase large subunit [Gemmataceae bacterium]|nr:phage terminase large subunit [Gemmataceae bacterium]